ncbi:lipocalin-like [Chaetodon auriga]|uniref:lipocalin-like n=1 Tax=Chaetodon auriga TaxID=39042 RepID=UPI0040330CB7
MTLPLRVLGALLCSLVVSAEVVPPADFNVEAMAGKWYLIGFATNAQWFVISKATMKVGTAAMTPTADGDLDLAFATLSSDGSCDRRDNLAKKTDMPGKFTYISKRWGDENDVRVFDVKYDEYAMFQTVKTKGGVPTVVNTLYARGMDLSADLQQKFRQFSLESGVQPDNIAFLPKNEECPAP